MNARLAHLLLTALVVTGPVVLAVKLFGDAPTVPATVSPAKASLIVITAGTWDTEPLVHPALLAMNRRGAGVREFLAPSPSRAASAASLWTGRWPSNHGVLADDLALAPGTWTLAEAARRSGLSTAVIAQERIASRYAIGGFQHVLEGPRSVADMQRDAQRAIEEFDGSDVVLWLHLTDAGPGGSFVGDLIETCESALAARHDQYDAVFVVTAFGRSGAGPPEERLSVPFWMQLPARLYGGERGKGIAQHSDPCGVILRLLRWEVPVPARGEKRDQSRTRMFYFALRGGTAEAWSVVETPEGHAVRDVSGTSGIRYLCRGPGRPVLARDDLEILQLDEAGIWVPVAEDMLEAVYRAHYEPHVRGFPRQATPAVPAIR